MRQGRRHQGNPGRERPGRGIRPAAVRHRLILTGMPAPGLPPAAQAACLRPVPRGMPRRSGARDVVGFAARSVQFHAVPAVSRPGWPQAITARAPARRGATQRDRYCSRRERPCLKKF
ncbi:hypothetical protein CBM2634_A240041 [Cupriavidus taiwanensis]|uniref:Uncharacterized protein n=1 Tax=Cupriavidus taiwanensis TaxID=164546 RepID=A0A375J0F4_9BURK|nr:hypothetical protein CBM2634_A240041 [Cupriavidus taiwanensis]